MFALLMEPCAAVTQWYIAATAENCGYEFRPRRFRSVSGKPLAATRGTLWFRGIPVEKHWAMLILGQMFLLLVRVYQ